MDVGGWLKSLGLEQYEAAFRENDVDAEVLPTLTADDFKDMGITSIGHRRRLLEAIAALRSKAGPLEVPAPSSPGHRSIPAHSQRRPKPRLSVAR